MRLTVALACLLFAGVRAGAQAQLANYTLGVGDVIVINVLNHPDLSAPSVIVLPDGKIQFPEVGEVVVAGRTPAEVAAEIQQKLGRTRNNAQVTVSVKEMHSRRVGITGNAIHTSGEFDLKPGYRLVDLIITAQGLAVKPELVRGMLIRHRQQVIDLQVEEAVKKPTSPANIALEPDDAVVLSATEKVRTFAFVMGKVQRPGPVVVDENTTLPMLIEQAGLPTEESAPEETYVLRGNNKIPLDLGKLAHGESDAMVTNFRVLPGDMIYVPESTKKYAVVGAASRTGYQRLPVGRSISVFEAVTLAGPNGADTGKVVLLREDNGAYSVTKIDLNKIIRTGNKTQDVPLKPGDVVYLPPKGGRPFNITDLLGPASLLFQFLRY